MNRILKVTKLHLNKPQQVFGVPLFIILAVLFVSMIIALILQRIGVDQASPEYIAGARQNMGVVWSLPGFLIYLGVQSISTTFPFAVALGSTRKAYVAGTALAHIIVSAYVAAVMAVLLLVELATGHWFLNAYTLDNIGLGSGNIWILIPTVFLVTMGCLSVGSVFGAIWVRFGPKGVIALSLILLLVIALTLLALAPKLVEIVLATTRTDLALSSVVIIALSLLGTWFSMRRTSVR